MDRNSQQPLPQVRGRPVSGMDAAHANEYFEQFLSASSLKHILGYYRGIIDNLHLKPNVLPLFYTKVKANLTSWKAKALWKKFDARASHKCYMKGKAAANTRVLVIGGGPCGLRTAIEAQLLGAKVVVIEKRDRFSRNNVLHLWPFVIEDLRMLGAKKFFGKFCAGAIDHISIRRLQCILLKVALLLGVEVHTEVGFEKLIEPNASEKTGWRAQVKPADHPVSQYEFDVIIGADGKRNTLQGFTRKEFRGKLAIAITANFINKKTEAEARVEEISGVAFIFNQKFFKDLLEETRIDLENIVYYKDDTHYFVMTAKKASLLEKGVIKQDLADTEKLLAPENVDREALEEYAIEAASFSTNYQMSNMEFAVNHYGQPDIAMFDFTSMFAADNASKVVERNGYRLLMILVGDSLLEPFWPTGSGCARGFLSSLDAAWAIRSWSLGTLTPLDVLAERESIYRLLAQTTPDNLNKDWKSYTLDPATRYPNLNKGVILPHQTVSLYITDNPESIERMKRNAQERPTEVPKKRRRGNVDNEVLLSWISEQLRDHDDITVTDIGSIFRDGKVLCAIIHHYRPDLLDYNAIKDEEPTKNNQLAADLLEKELGIPPIMTGEELTSTEDYLSMASYLTQVYDTFRGEIPHIKQPKLKLRSKIPKRITLSSGKCSSTSLKKVMKLKPNKNGIKLEAKSSKIERIKKKLLEKISNNTDQNNAVKCKRQHDTNMDGILSQNVKNESKKCSLIERYKKIDFNNKCSRRKQENIDSKITDKSGPVLPRVENQNSKLSQSLTDESGELIEEEKVLKPRKKYIKVIKRHRNKDESRAAIQTANNVVEQERNVQIKTKTKVILKKKLKAKKSRLSIIPEIKAEQVGNNKNKDASASTTFVTSPICPQECEPTQPEKKECNIKNLNVENNTFNVYNCNAVYSNNVFEQDCKDVSSQLRMLDQAYSDDLGIKDSLMQPLNNFLSPDKNSLEEFRTIKRTSNLNNSLNQGKIVNGFKTCDSSSIPVNKLSLIYNPLWKFDTPPNVDRLVKIRLIEKKTKNKFTYQQIEYSSDLKQLTVSSKACIVKPKRNDGKQLKNTNKITHAGDANLKLSKTCQQNIWTKLGGCDILKNLPNFKCQKKLKSHKRKYPVKKMTMSEGDGLQDQAYSRVSNWISSHDFMDRQKMDFEAETVISNDVPSDITSVTRALPKRKNKNEYDDIIIEERTDVVKCSECKSPGSSDHNFAEMMRNINTSKAVRTVSKFSQYSPFQATANLKSASAPPTQFSIIVEGEESELPESNKRSDLSFKSIKATSFQPMILATQPSRPSSRHKRHADAMVASKAPSIDRKTRKRRTLEKIGASVEERQKMLEEIASNRTERHNKRRQQRKLQTEQFLKSMQMLQANAKDSEPFEDYSIFLYRQTAPKFKDRVKDLEKQFTYVPEHEGKVPNITSRTAGTDEDLAARIKSLEQKWLDPQPVEKKPKDLLRAIGKIETSDWNVKEIEKKIMENKLGKPSKTYDKEKVPKWSKEQFLARQTKMEKQHLDRQDSAEAKFAEIDKSIKSLDQKLKEGTVRELGLNKVASITEKLVSKVPAEPKPIEKSNNRPPVTLPTPSGSEFCHFCGKRVYLMERLSAEGRFFHHGCFKCQYCQTQLRLGSYAFDRDGMYGFKFFCLHHYGMVGELPVTKVIRKPSQKPREVRRSPEKRPLSGVAGVDLLDRVQTPERIEFSNLSTGNVSSDHEESLSQMDEDEWTDKNFGASCAENDSEDESSSLSDTDSDDEGAFDDALEEPVTKEGTMKWAERWKNSYSRKKHDSDSNGYSSSDQSSYYENSSDDDDSDTATEGEDEIRARELRKQEVRVEPPVVQTDTGTDTEVVSDETSSESSSSEIHNSATEISTDSEFAQDDPTPTREIPAIILNDFHVTKTRGSGGMGPKKIQVTTGYLQRPFNGKPKKPNIELKLKPLVPSAPTIKKPAPVLLPRTEGYALNRTQSTGGIAAKVSLELKKKYLLGEATHGSIQKSGSASTLDSKFKTFQTAISDCQKLLKPAPEISASMQTFCNKLDERQSPVLSPQSSVVFAKPIIIEPQELSKENELPPPDVTNVTLSIIDKQEVPETPEPEPYVFENESEGRPRSPVHETSIIVPNIDWSKKNLNQSTDSLCPSSSENEKNVTSNFQFRNIPRVEIHTANDNEEEGRDEDENIPPDSLCVEVQEKSPVDNSLSSELAKSITSEKKSLNQPKSLPNLDNFLPEIHNALHVNLDKKSAKNSSGFSSPDSGAEQATAALTETELSDWARDGAVSDDLEDIEFEFGREFDKIKKSGTSVKANIPEFNESVHVCSKEKKDIQNKTIITEAMNSFLSANLDNIEFMDTGTETSSDDGQNVDSQNGYVLFKNEDDFAEDSLNPNINEIVEAKNAHVDEKYVGRNTGYCILANDDKSFSGSVDDIKPSDLAKLKQKQMLADPEEDSLLIVETGTTTEENTCSDSTVKNITEKTANKNQPVDQKTPTEDETKKRLEEKLAEVKAEVALREQEKEPSHNVDSNIEFEEHCQRLQSKVEFGNVKDSIDVRKSRRKSKSDSPQKPDLIQEEKLSPLNSTKGVALSLTPSPRTPDLLYKREVLKKERDVNQRLVQEMVMNKMKAENKTLERKRRSKATPTGLCPNRPYDLTKSATTDVSQINLDNSNRSSTYSTGSSTYTTPDVLLTTNMVPLQYSQSENAVPELESSNDVFSTPLSTLREQNRPLSMYSDVAEKKSEAEQSKNTETFSMPHTRDVTPKAPPRQHRLHEDAGKTAEKLKQDARARARLLSNKELGLSPEEKLQRLKEKIISKRGKENENGNPLVQDGKESLVINSEKRNSWLYSNDTLSKKKNSLSKRSKSNDGMTSPKLTAYNNNVDDLGPVRTKSISDFPKSFSTICTDDEQNEARKMCKSDPNILEMEFSKPKKKSKDRERRKSITRLITTLFTKRSPSGSKGLFSKLSPKSKDKSKDVVVEELARRKSLSEITVLRNFTTPPPVPPLPLNYSIKGTDGSSEGEHDWKKQDRSSCDTLDTQSGILENSMSSLSGRRSGKSARKVARQAQLKRHRMAQEIQRKLEETEVKTRELEMRGVLVEKALRGENKEESSKDEAELLQEWFDLMRDRTELHRYEKELSVRAKELELEDRHARLQHELRERLEKNEPKTEDDLKIEESIINEMMEIVDERDSIIASIEEDRLRYSNEDRDLEEQMLVKGLRLTPIRKTPEK